MTISVISNVAGSIGLAASSPAALASSSIGDDFAALLSGQTLASSLALTQEGTPSLASKLESRGIPIKESGAKDDAVQDPSIFAATMGLPAAHVTPPLPVSSQPISGENDSALSRSIVADFSKRASPKFDADDNSSSAKGNLNVINMPQESAAQAATSGEAANIAVELTENIGSSGNFQIAMSHANLQQEKITHRQQTVSQPLSSDTWPAQFSEKIVWLAKNDQQSAQININPPQLGPIQITLQLNGDQANAIFASPHPEVRQAIESAMPQLREMLSSAGISLGDANVGANLAQQRQDTLFQSANKAPSGDENAILPANENTASAVTSRSLRSGRGMVDLFA